jgi:16S rRNA C967 or C1407 C5-methylase (RsmB/RsmF family)
MGLDSISLPLDVLNKLTKGLKNYKGQDLESSLDKTYRVYPHHLNSIGFYFAKFIKQ